MTIKYQEAYIVTATRTPVAKRKGVFRNVRPDDMLAHVLKAVTASVPDLDLKEIGDVVIGCAMPEGEQGVNMARIGVLLAGMPDSVPAVTINRFCSSALNAIAMAADRIRCGDTDVAIAGGSESMTIMPQLFGKQLYANPAWMINENIALAYGMGITAEKVAERWKVTREEQDRFAARSHALAIAAISSGKFRAEISPYTVHHHLPNEASGEVRVVEQVCYTDEGPRAASTFETLSKLRPAFAERGSVTAGNSSQMSDGAGAVLLMSEAAVTRYKLTPLARFVSFSVAGVPPEIMGIGPLEAIPKALKAAGIRQSDLDWIELNEAFAAQALAVMKQLDLDPQRVNPQGGAIALGHPLGATGAIRAATLLHGMRREGGKYGMITMCIGTGMGAAGIFEAL